MEIALATTESASEVRQMIPEGIWNVVAAGYHSTDYFLFYFGMDQPRLRKFNLPQGNFRIDVIDTWNMTIETFAQNASGKMAVSMPARKYMAVRIQKVV
jgi:hypothetical protein